MLKGLEQPFGILSGLVQTFEGLLDMGFVVGIGDAKPGAVTGKYLNLCLVSGNLVGNEGGDIPFGGKGVWGVVEKLSELVFERLNKGGGKPPEVHGANGIFR